MFRLIKMNVYCMTHRLEFYISIILSIMAGTYFTNMAVNQYMTAQATYQDMMKVGVFTSGVTLMIGSVFVYLYWRMLNDSHFERNMLPLLKKPMAAWGARLIITALYLLMQLGSTAVALLIYIMVGQGASIVSDPNFLPFVGMELLLFMMVYSICCFCAYFIPNKLVGMILSLLVGGFDVAICSFLSGLSFVRWLTPKLLSYKITYLSEADCNWKNAICLIAVFCVLAFGANIITSKKEFD